MTILLLLRPEATWLAKWHDFFEVMAGCAATLTGLLFVGVASHLKILFAQLHLAIKARAALALLVSVLLVAGCCLIPDQPLPRLGLEILAVGVVSWILTSAATIHNIRLLAGRLPVAQWISVLFGQAATLPLLISGSYLLAGNPIGVHALPAAMLCVFIGVSLDAWLLLVAANR